LDRAAGHLEDGVVHELVVLGVPHPVLPHRPLRVVLRDLLMEEYQFFILFFTQDRSVCFFPSLELFLNLLLYQFGGGTGWGDVSVSLADDCRVVAAADGVHEPVRVVVVHHMEEAPPAPANIPIRF
jgi:hypothetical protein